MYCTAHGGYQVQPDKDLPLKPLSASAAVASNTQASHVNMQTRLANKSNTQQALVKFVASNMQPSQAVVVKLVFTERITGEWRLVERSSAAVGCGIRGSSCVCFFLCGRLLCRVGIATISALDQRCSSKTTVYQLVQAPSAAPACSLTDNFDRQCTRSARLRANALFPSAPHKTNNCMETAQVYNKSSDNLCKRTSRTKCTKQPSCCGCTQAW